MAEHDSAFGLSIAEFARRGGFSVRTTKRLIQHGYINSVKIGDLRIIPAGEGERLIERAKTEAIDLTGKGKPPAEPPKPKRPVSPRMAAHLQKLHAKRRAAPGGK